MFSVEGKIKHLEKLGIKGNLDEIEKMYRG